MTGMKLFVAILLTALLSFIVCLQFDWWAIAIVAFAVGVLVQQKAWKSFVAGFAGIFILWVALAEWIDMENGGILSQKIAALFGLGTNSVLLILIAGLIGGLVGGFAALSGSYIRKK
jgi:hypothetical protein